MRATGSRLRPLLRPLSSSPFSQPKLQALSLSSSSSDDSSCRSPRVFVDDPGTGSIAYRHTLRTQRPPTIRWQKELENSASFIGTVISPLKTFTTAGGILVHTQLKVEPPSGSKKFVRIFLDMWDDMAELSIQHLKPNDYIYVSGYLQSFTRALENGNVILYHKVLVKEINFVANSNQKSNNTEDQEESPFEKRRKRLYLWQVFFANPYEWQDLRKRKVNPSQPDFKHKGSGEALWLSSRDPPWVTRQLQLQDSRMGDMGLRSSRTLDSFRL
ncbi:hypothetical protein L1987_23186 [Smallanthus sonchifolius]|uniref:Uncharacterized protein n=1 Tax=Smallanthus sonchifolius TaxID=185202 RepID=A0ACB9IHJ3_9ASTR|nr:hypothetical protein L1987_23186 [Smallanthus sonchifolius]